MRWTYLALLVLLACSQAGAKPGAEILAQSEKPAPVPFTQAANYMSHFGFLRYRYFSPSSARQSMTPSIDLKGTNWSGIDIYSGVNVRSLHI
jgi:hypothetical protein